MNYLRNFLHFRLILPLQRYVIIIIFAVARNILQHLNERRKLHTLVGRNAAGFKNHQVGNRLKKLVELVEDNPELIEKILVMHGKQQQKQQEDLDDAAVYRICGDIRMKFQEEQ